MTKYQLPISTAAATHDLHFGLRKDNHSRFGGETTLRGGFVSQWQRYTVKLLYGEAYQEPSARLLYGGWQGSGSDPRLKPRHANTWEINLNYQLKEWLFSTYYYQMRSRDLFNTTDTGAVNAGRANTEGGDFRVKYRPATSMLDNLTLWASANWLKTNDQVVNEQGQLTWQRNGDVAQDTLHFGGYFTFNDNWQVNLRGRHYGRRNTVETNPLANVPSFHTLDLNLGYQPASTPQVKYALDITNLTDRDYFHPGVRSASASVSNPGGINSDGVWIGSESFYNAQIPQPGREFRLSIYWQF